MAKRIFIILLTLSVLISFSSCFNDLFNILNKEDKSNGSGHSSNCHEGTSHIYGLQQMCKKGDKYIKATSFAISTSYGTDEITTDGDQYYVILGVETNLSEEELADRRNKVRLYDLNVSRNLNFVLYDSENGKLIYEIPKNEGYDYSKLTDLRPLGTNVHTLSASFEMEIHTLSKYHPDGSVFEIIEIDLI